MQSRFWHFMKKRFPRAGAACPMYIWDQFVVREFNAVERCFAEDYTNKLIDRGYITIDKRTNGDFIVISGYGYEMIKKGFLVV